MMLWDLIRDFYVMYIFGGYSSDLVNYHGYLGHFYDSSSDYLLEDNYTNAVYFNFKGYSSVEGVYFDYYSLGDYLSTIATIITLIVILLVCFHIIKKCFNVFTRIL